MLQNIVFGFALLIIHFVDHYRYLGHTSGLTNADDTQREVQNVFICTSV